MWDTVTIKDALWYQWRLNGAEAYLRRDGDTWRIAFKTIPFMDMYDDFGGVGEIAPPASLPTIMAAGKGEQVSLHPYVFKKPYFLTLQDKVRLLPDMEVRFNVALPPVLQFELAGDCLTEGMPFLLAETWDGDDTMSGVLCAVIPQLIRPFYYGALESLPPGSSLTAPDAPDRFKAGSLIHGEVILRNRSKGALDLDHLVIYTESIDLFEHEGRLICDVVIVDALGGGDLRMNTPSVVPKGYRKISAGIKDGVGDRLIRHGAGFLRNITTL
ncbi:MAG: hypothetical protein LBT14_13060 [Treponema sp.]|jgi:hypothetical protein|nr:hypothetical protein [Treponema sp.]